MVDNHSEASTTSSERKRYPVIPDGGYGWVITFASFMCHFVADGISFTFGVIFTDLLEEFQASKSMTSWIGSLFIGVPLICAPVAGLFVNRYGCRITTVAGSLITSIGLLLSSYAVSVEMLIVTYGIIAGVGLSFVYVPSSVIPSFWFEKKRSLATGIAVSGSGIGTFAMAPLIKYFIDLYGWRGALLMLSGVTLNMIVFGALFKPAPDGVRAMPDSASVLSETIGENNNENAKIAADTLSLTSCQTFPLRSFASEEILPVTCRIHHGEADWLVTTEAGTNTEVKGDVIEKMEPMRHPRVHLQSTASRHHEGIPLNQLLRSTNSLLPLSRRDITSVITLAERRRFTSSCPELSMLSSDIGSQSNKGGFVCRTLRKLRILGQEMCDIRLFRVPVYLLFFCSNFLLSYAYDMPYIYLVDYAKNLDIGNAPFLISIIGIVNMFGQILYGFVGDKKQINTIILYGVSIALCGGLVALLPIMKDYASLATFSGLFGLFISASFSLETIVVVKILSLDQLTKAYSLLMFGQGVAALIGPPIGGLLWDITKSYQYTFIFSGTSMVLSGILVLMIMFFYNRGRKSRATSISTEVSA